MGDFKFKPEDFSSVRGQITKENVAADANERLAAHLAKLPKVEGRMLGSRYVDFSSGEPFEGDTHEAILWNVKEIEKPKECEHTSIRQNINHSIGQCFECGVMLKQTWVPA